MQKTKKSSDITMQKSRKKPYCDSIFIQEALVYEQQLLKKGIKEKEVRTRLHNVTRFLRAVQDCGIERLSEINPRLIHELYQQDGCRMWFTVAIKSFLRYLYTYGVVKKDYSNSVPVGKLYKGIPSVYSEKELDQIEDSIDTTSRAGVRNYTIFFIIRKYALRVGDIANLKIKDIDFQYNKVSLVQDKTNEPITFVLSSDVINVLKKYINESRNDSNCEYLFLTVNGEPRKLTPDNISGVIRKIIKESGVDINGRKCGPHSLRASKATHMLEAGRTMTDVSKYLGHTSIRSTMSYLKISTELLRQCSLPVGEITNVRLLEYLGETK